MGVSTEWLKKYVDYDWSAEELAHNLTMAGIAVEGVEAIDNDQVLELDLTPNRGDCLGMINLAREVAALAGSKLKVPDIFLRENEEKISDYIKVDIDAPDLCSRYAARVVKNVKIGPSPEWMQEALLHSGIRPINNVVDITNYVMLEANQPLHAFDYRLLPEQRILVRRAHAGEHIVTLDDVDRVLDQDVLVITDGIKPVALAGIMGGQNTEISESTNMVLIESAHFDPVNTRRTSRKVNLRSDSSIRFEKGTDIQGVIFAVNRAAQLMQDLAGGEVVNGICDAYPQPRRLHTIKLRPDRVNQILGTDLSTAEIKGYLDRLSLPVQMTADKEALEVQVPTYRPDLQMEVDLIEEVARLHGYNRLPSELPAGPTTRGGLNPYQRFQAKVRNTMASSLREVINYSFINNDVFDRIMLPEDDPRRNVIRIANPLSEEQGVMRTMLVPGLLWNISRNLARRNQNLAFFEMGAVFIPGDDKLPRESLKLCAAVAGRSQTSWLQRPVEMDFFYLKGILEDLMNQIRVADWKLVASQPAGFHPGRTATIICHNEEVGVIGEIHPQVMENFDIKTRTVVMELDVEKLYEYAAPIAMTESIVRFPAIERDIAVLLPLETASAAVVDLIQESCRPLLKDVTLFDLFTGGQLEPGLKSMAFRLVFQSDSGTLKDDDVNPIIEKVLEALQARLGARLR